MNPTLKAPGSKRLNLYYDEPPSNFAFTSNLRRYIKEMALPPCHMFCQFYVANGELRHGPTDYFRRACCFGFN